MYKIDRRGGGKNRLKDRLNNRSLGQAREYLLAWPPGYGLGCGGGRVFDSIVFNFKIFQFIFMYIEQKCPEKETGSTDPSSPSKR